jgi:hypothetical protein
LRLKRQAIRPCPSQAGVASGTHISPTPTDAKKTLDYTEAHWNDTGLTSTALGSAERESNAMARPEPKKRPLEYEDLDAMMADVCTLQTAGYISHGNWTLGQACGHVAEWMRFPLDGFPNPPLPLRLIFRVMKTTGMAGRMARKILEEGFRGGMPAAPETVPDVHSISDEQGIEKLQQVVDRVRNFEGALHPSPLFGQMDMATHIKVSLLHAAHHFGYLEPRIAS